MDDMTRAAVAELKAITEAAHGKWFDMEDEHSKADDILLRFVPPEVRAAYQEARHYFAYA